MRWVLFSGGLRPNSHKFLMFLWLSCHIFRLDTWLVSLYSMSNVNSVFLNLAPNLCCQWWYSRKKSCTSSYSEHPAIYINLRGYIDWYIMNWWLLQNINRVNHASEIVQPYFPNMNRSISRRRSWLKLGPNTWDAQQTGNNLTRGLGIFCWEIYAI